MKILHLIAGAAHGDGKSMTNERLDVEWKIIGALHVLLPAGFLVSLFMGIFFAAHGLILERLLGATSESCTSSR